MISEGKGFSTKTVHAGSVRDSSTGAVVPPIYETSVFAFSSTKEMIDIMSEKAEGYVYTRYGNPTVRAVEMKMAKLEEAEDAAVFSSGMAAITTTILTLVSSGDHLVSTRDLYGGTLEFFQSTLPKFDVKVSLVDATNFDLIKSAIRKNTEVIYVETPTNPTLKVVDLSKVAKLGKKNRIAVVVDSTFASPYNLRPTELGVNIVIHSATKYLGGHNDVTAGVVCGARSFVQKLKGMRKNLGGTLDPFAAWLLLRGLKTLGLRMARHNLNGMQVAKYLEKHHKVKKVYYPGLPSHPHYSLAKRQMKGFGGVVSFEIDGDFETTMRFVDNLKLCYLAGSLGGTETLVAQPILSSHYFVSIEDRKKAGITDQLVRLALGIEDSEDIIADLEQAFNKI
ncbi:MAG: aminotransferase class I/II-fold pyridoxal phosphate-dependent enzyme [Candidatus Bathyarchaeota archaeon]|nr:aminotransferase class I/II-fold pyridoxal phosphate-dependent enzyme [Candidatus Bathyarchaeota archaeon]MDH5787145.1 aminotransferase class I/II-fold pyridoxal phosphate-dependent enzyme [Candidatus Bathyarchaeota archaeon]